MNFLKNKTSWSNFELAILKVCLLSIGALFGIYLFELLKEYTIALWLIAIVFTTYGFYLWLTKSKQK